MFIFMTLVVRQIVRWKFFVDLLSSNALEDNMERGTRILVAIFVFIIHDGNNSCLVIHVWTVVQCNEWCLLIRWTGSVEEMQTTNLDIRLERYFEIGEKIRDVEGRGFKRKEFANRFMLIIAFIKSKQMHKFKIKQAWNFT
jgi:hypothetical protein